MVLATILAGGFSTFISHYLLNTTAGTLSLQHQFPTGQNPSWISLHPAEGLDGRALYAVNEIPEGAVQSFLIPRRREELILVPKSTVSSGGSSPTYVESLANGDIAVANFGSRTCRMIPTVHGDPTMFDTRATLIGFPAPSNPHAAFENGAEVFVPDLGADKVWRLGLVDGTWNRTGSIDQPKGSGPRHALVRNGTLFTLHEFDSTVTAHTLNETTEPVVSPSIAPRDASTPNGAKFAAAELLSPPPSDMFPEGLLYASNRNVGLEDPRGDSIAIIRYFPSSAPGVKARFDIIEQVFTGLQQIRGMAFSGDGEFLVAGGSKSGGVKVFQRSGGGTVLTEIASNADVDTRTSFVWL